MIFLAGYQNLTLSHFGSYSKTNGFYIFKSKSNYTLYIFFFNSHKNIRSQFKCAIFCSKSNKNINFIILAPTMSQRIENAPEEEGLLEEPNTTVVYIIIEYSDDRIISAAIFNNVRRSLQLCSFLDNEHYVNLQAFLIQVNPKEDGDVFKIVCQLPDLNTERKKILSKLQDLDIVVKDGKGQSVSVNNVSSVIQNKLKFLLKEDPKIYQKEQQDKRSLLALDLLLGQLLLQKEKTNKQQFNLSLFENQNIMKLDKACLNALNIFPKNMEKKIISTNSTLYDILNKCKTAFGTRCLKRWMKQPLQDVKMLTKRLELLEYFIENQGIKNIIQSELKRLPDMEKVFYVFYRVDSGKRHKCEVNDLIKLYRIITCIGELVQKMEGRDGGDFGNEHIQEIHKSLLKDYKFIEKIAGMIEKCIDTDPERGSQYMVRADTQPELLAIKKDLDENMKKIREEKKNVQEFLKSDVQIVESQTYRFVFESNKKGLVEKVKQTNKYKFITAKQTKMSFTTDNLINLCRSVIALEEQYQEAQQGILNKMYKIVAGYYPVMERLSSTLAEMDVLIGWSTIVTTSTATWCRPQFKKGIIGLQMRHPCVKNCIPNDITIDRSKTIILTGPNMGGKSTYIRTIGVCVYLAHLGMFVPASGFECPIIDSIICRVGASDQQIKGISTFMGEMIETSCMLKTATDKSLVLIDQLGRGTSTNEGFGLSWSLCKYLHTKINPYCLFATHFHEMIQIQDEVEGITNMYTACKLNEANNLEFQYRVYRGKVQKSYGIQVAKMLSFPQEIIQDAETYLEVYENKQRTKDYGLSKEQETHLSNLVDQMNRQLEKSHHTGTKDKIKELYMQKAREYLGKN